jgi:hypothetical protein
VTLPVRVFSSNRHLPHSEFSYDGLGLRVIWRLGAAGVLCPAVALHCSAVLAQGGPPFLSNDPGTPGNGNWEINIASMQIVTHAAASYQVPQIDLNFGVGDRIQLTYEVPYVLQTGDGKEAQSGWSNAYPGIKWRFLDQGEEGWQLSTFPQVETGASMRAQQSQIASPGPRLLLPLEAAKKLGPFDLDFEAGYYFPKHGPREQILGLVAGHSLTERFELDAEIYNDRAMGAPPNTTIVDGGGRYKLSRGFLALFMAGRGVGSDPDGRPQFVGYFGVQILLSDYGRALASEP